jgi:hypothetical protein
MGLTLRWPILMAVSGAVLTVSLSGMDGWGQGRKARADGDWMFQATGSAKAGPSAAAPAEPATGAKRQHKPSEPPGHIFGYPTSQDPLFDKGTRLPYARQHLERPVWNRPSYQDNLPQYVKPSWAQDPIRKPMYHMPLAVEPLDNKPKYNIKNYMAPSDFKPSYEFPTYMERPNYVIKPIEKPAINRPGYDRSTIFYNRPEYLPPTYVPQEYKPPRYAPSPFIGPPR